MKRPQIHGNKVVTRYSDKTSMVLKSYLDMSAQRLSKIRAGANLTEVLDTEAPVLSHKPRPPQPKINKSVTHGHHSNRSDKGATAKQIPLSRFMEDYLTQRNIDEALLSKKENNIYDFFKEKYELMGKYLGEDILQDGLLAKSPNIGMHYQQDKPKKVPKNIEAEIRDQYLLSLVTPPAGEKESRSIKALKINRGIMEQILREEREEELNALIQLQTQQNMQVFNGLQEIGLQENDKINSPIVSPKTPPSKIIVKGNFLRTFVNVGNPNDQNVVIINPPSPQLRTNPRPQSDYLIFRTQNKKDNILPDIPKISLHFDSRKFGERSTTYLDTQGDTLLSTAQLINNKHSPAVSPSKVEIPQITKESLKPGTSHSKFDKDLSTTSRPDFSMIKDEIDFLYHQKSNSPEVYNPVAARKVRQPIQYFKQIPESDVKQPIETLDLATEKPKELEATPSKGLTKEIKKLRMQTTQGLPFKQPSQKTQTSDTISIYDSKRIANHSKKKLSLVSPKLESSSPIDAPMNPTKNSFSFKKDIKNFYSRSLITRNQQEKNRSFEPESVSSQKLSFMTKLVPVKKEDTMASMNGANGLFFTSSQLPVSANDTRGMTKTFTDANSSRSIGMSKTTFGQKFWKSNVQD